MRSSSRRRSASCRACFSSASFANIVPALSGGELSRFSPPARQKRSRGINENKYYFWCAEIAKQNMKHNLSVGSVTEVDAGRRVDGISATIKSASTHAVILLPVARQSASHAAHVPGGPPALAARVRSSSRCSRAVMVRWHRSRCRQGRGTNISATLAINTGVPTLPTAHALSY